MRGRKSIYRQTKCGTYMQEQVASYRLRIRILLFDKLPHVTYRLTQPIYSKSLYPLKFSNITDFICIYI